MQATNEDGSPAVPMKLIEIPGVGLLGHVYRGPNGLQVIAGREMGAWHISVSHAGRYPTWDELRDVAWALQPARSFSIIIPAKTAGSSYLNVHEHCIHLWESRGE